MGMKPLPTGPMTKVMQPNTSCAMEQARAHGPIKYPLTPILSHSFLCYPQSNVCRLNAHLSPTCIERHRRNVAVYVLMIVSWMHNNLSSKTDMLAQYFASNCRRRSGLLLLLMLLLWGHLQHNCYALEKVQAIKRDTPAAGISVNFLYTEDCHCWCCCWCVLIVADYYRWYSGCWRLDVVHRVYLA